MTKNPPSSAIHLVAPTCLKSLSADQAARFFSSNTILASPQVVAVVADASKLDGCHCCDNINSSKASTPLDKEHMMMTWNKNLLLVGFPSFRILRSVQQEKLCWTESDEYGRRLN